MYPPEEPGRHIWDVSPLRDSPPVYVGPHHKDDHSKIYNTICPLHHQDLSSHKHEMADRIVYRFGFLDEVDMVQKYLFLIFHECGQILTFGLLPIATNPGLQSTPNFSFETFFILTLLNTLSKADFKVLYV